jgi:hypothetical protein
VEVQMMNDLILEKDYQKGMRGKKVRLIQEWLCLHGCHIVIDGDFGDATDAAVRQFQKEKKLKPDGIVEEKTFEKLVLPMTEALKEIPPDNKTLGQMVVAYAEKHLEHHPLEVGGQNKGPWVRLYMQGNEGRDWPWCAGFVSSILKQASKSLDISPPIQTSFSCDSLAASAKERGLFLKESLAKENTAIAPGSLFLVRRTSTDWVHTGIVLSAENSIFHTIEGNTNDDGDREGYELCRRIRNYEKKDFILLA